MQSGRPVVFRSAVVTFVVLTTIISTAAYLILSDPTRDAGDLRPGDCIAIPAGSFYVDTVETVSCDEEHDIEIFDVGPLDITSADYSQWSGIERQAEDACLAAFANYVGVDWEQSIYEISYFTPTREGWMWGEESYQCALGSRSGPKTGSAKGSGR